MKRHAFNEVIFFRLPLCLPKNFIDTTFSTFFRFNQVCVDIRFLLLLFGNLCVPVEDSLVNSYSVGLTFSIIHQVLIDRITLYIYC